MSNKILQLVSEINDLALKAIKGPMCIDPKFCTGACCFCSNEVPKILVDYYIENNIAKKTDFKVSDLLCYRILIKNKYNRCSLFDFKKNGCKIFKSNIELINQ